MTKAAGAWKDSRIQTPQPLILAGSERRPLYDLCMLFPRVTTTLPRLSFLHPPRLSHRRIHNMALPFTKLRPEADLAILSVLRGCYL